MEQQQQQQQQEVEQDCRRSFTSPPSASVRSVSPPSPSMPPLDESDDWETVPGSGGLTFNDFRWIRRGGEAQRAATDRAPRLGLSLLDARLSLRGMRGLGEAANDDDESSTESTPTEGDHEPRIVELETSSPVVELIPGYRHPDPPRFISPLGAYELAIRRNGHFDRPNTRYMDTPSLAAELQNEDEDDDSDSDSAYDSIWFESTDSSLAAREVRVYPDEETPVPGNWSDSQQDEEQGQENRSCCTCTVL